MFIYIPTSVDVDTLIKLHKPSFKGFKKDFLLYVIHTIVCRSQLVKDNVYFDYVSLNSSVLQSIKHNYKAHLLYLEQHDIIKSDKQYIAGKKSIGYRLCSEHQKSKIQCSRITDFKIKQKLSFFQKEADKTVRGLEHLTKWFNDKLTVDANIATSFASQELMIKKKFKALRDTKRARNKKI
ncbi:hypothetical protein [Spongiimicrobium salis]|uniref:hypothetical protein n=1 Tax=Spongiimicrobium salis TaxID=1667022 RepID=UPI00374D244A